MSSSKGYHDNLLEFARGYVEEAGSSMDEVGITKASSPLALVRMTGATCVRTQRSGLGYDILEFDSDSSSKFLLILDRMSGYWVLIQ